MTGYLIQRKGPPTEASGAVRGFLSGKQGSWNALHKRQFNGDVLRSKLGQGSTMVDETGDTVSQAYETVAWRGLMLALLAQVMVPAPNDEDKCAAFLDTVLSDILDQTVTSEAMPAELGREALRAELERVNERMRADLAGARADREKLRAEFRSPTH